METEKKLLESLENDPDVQFLKNEYPDVWKPIGKVIEKVADNSQRRIDELSTEVDKQGRQRLYDDLDKNVPDWESVNTSPEFGEWLEQEDRYTGLSRKQLLLNAYQQHDSETVQHFFEDFTKETGSNVSNAKHVIREDRDNSEPELIKSSEVRKFYDDVQRGRYVGMESEMRKEEARIEKAVAEGRVV